MPAQWFEPLKNRAQWIWHPQAVAGRHDRLHFFGEIAVPANAATVELRPSADNRYILYVIENDTPRRLGRGPARSDQQNTSLDTYTLDVTPGQSLQLLADVLWLLGAPEMGLGEMHSTRPGFLCFAIFRDAAGNILHTTGTNNTWRVKRLEHLQWLVPGGIGQYHCIGAFEHHLAAAAPASFLPDNTWTNAARTGDPYFRGDQPYMSHHRWLIEREIAQPYERPHAFTNAPALPLRIPANTTQKLILDAGELVNAYPRLRANGGGGAGATIKITYAERLLRANTTEKRFTITPDAVVQGFSDQITLGETPYTFETFHWRCFRFIELAITAGPSDVIIDHLSALATAYPFEDQSAFTAHGEHESLMQQFREVSFRTLRDCAWETYMDCPYYEQLQYVGDTRIQVLLTYVLTGDPTLPAQSLRAFDRSRLPNGLTQSRFPSAEMQIIPTFSLIYILMLDDYLTHVGDEALIAELRGGIGPILNFFTTCMHPDTQLIGRVPFWPFMDWVHGWNAGMPRVHPDDPHERSSLINMLYIMALDAAARIYETQRAGAGNLYDARANQLRAKVREVFYDERLGLVHDTPVAITKKAGTQPILSQHAQALAALSGVLKFEESRRALKLAFDPQYLRKPGPKSKTPSPVTTDLKSDLIDTIDPASYYFRFYLGEAIAHVNLGEYFWPLLEPFREALARGSTTWPEAFEPSRSECHAWSSWPVYFLARHLLGIAPPALEDAQIRVAPLHCPPLSKVSGTYLTATGAVTVSADFTQSPPKIEATGPNTRIVGRT